MQNALAEAYIPNEVQLDPNILNYQEFRFQEAKQLEEFTFVSRRAEQLARETAAKNTHEFFNGGHEQAVYPNDVLGYHRRYVELEQSGADENRLIWAKEARLHNVRSDFGEKMQAMTWDLPEPRVYQVGEDGKVYDADLYPIGEMLMNGLSALNNPIEGERRIIEASNFAVIESAAKLDDATERAFIEISMCNHEKGTNGYVKDIDKMQIRYSRYVDGPNGRELVMQPIYVDGRLFNDARMARFLTSFDGQIPREDILDRMLQVDATEFEDVVDFIMLMDSFATEEDGRGVFMGEYGDGDYSKLSAISSARYEMHETAVATIDHFSDKKAREGLNPIEAEAQVEALQKRLALQICKANPGLAKVVFDHQTENMLVQVAQLEQQGQFNQAQSLYLKTLEGARDLQGCGAACGIEDANAHQARRARAKGLKDMEDGTLKLDKLRKCPGCKEVGGLTYGLDSSGNVVAYCQHCEKTNNDKPIEEKDDKIQEVKPEVKPELELELIHTKQQD